MTAEYEREQPHNYIGAAANVGNGMINEVLNHQGQLMLTYGESAAAGAALRFSPPVVRGGALVLGTAYGAYELATNAPAWMNDASTVVNASSYSAQEQAKAHLGLEHIGGGIVELSAGYHGFKRGMYAPEIYGVARSVYSDYSTGALKANELLPAWQTRFETARKAVDWKANPPWMLQSADALKSKFADLRWLKPASAESETEGLYASAPSADTMARYREAVLSEKSAAPPRVFSGMKDGQPFTVTEEPDHFVLRAEVQPLTVTGESAPRRMPSSFDLPAVAETKEGAKVYTGIKDGQPFTITEQPDHFA